jgi:hypothetical protein
MAKNWRNQIENEQIFKKEMFIIFHMSIFYFWNSIDKYQNIFSIFITFRNQSVIYFQ